MIKKFTFLPTDRSFFLLIVLLTVISCGGGEDKTNTPSGNQTPNLPTVVDQTQNTNARLAIAGTIDSIFPIDNESMLVYGDFNGVGSYTGHGSFYHLKERNPTKLPGPIIEGGDVLRSTADGEGGWYLCGRFVSVSGESSLGYVHIHADGTVDPNWKPNNKLSPSELAPNQIHFDGSNILVVRGDTLTALNSSDGDVVWEITIDSVDSQAKVYALTSHNERFYVGGNFVVEAVDDSGQSRQIQHLASIHSRTGVVDPDWGNANDAVTTMSTDSNAGTIYIGGRFDHIGIEKSTTALQARKYLAAIDAAGNVTAWNPNINNEILPYNDFVGPLIYHNGIIYISGEQLTEQDMDGLVSVISPEEVPLIVAVDEQGHKLAWQPEIQHDNFYDRILGMDIYKGSLIIAGRYSTELIDKKSTLSNSLVSSLDSSNGQLLWSIGFIDDFTSISVSGDKLFVRNRFEPERYTERKMFARITKDGQLLETSFDHSKRVEHPVYIDNKIYAVESFLDTSGTRNLNLVAFDLEGNKLDWGPIDLATGSNNPQVSAIAVDEKNVYIGGSEHLGETRSYLLAFRRDTGERDDTIPDTDGPVYTIHALADSLYIGGSFTAVSDVPAQAFAEIHKGTGEVRENSLEWSKSSIASPSSPFLVHHITSDNQKIFILGNFTAVNNQSRPGVAALDYSGKLTEWQPSQIADGFKPFINVINSAVYIANDPPLDLPHKFLFENWQPLQVFDAQSGQEIPFLPPTPWTVRQISYISDVQEVGGKIVIGGHFSVLGSTGYNDLAIFPAP